jgi:hypothetical protein
MQEKGPANSGQEPQLSSGKSPRIFCVIDVKGLSRAQSTCSDTSEFVGLPVVEEGSDL